MRTKKKRYYYVLDSLHLLETVFYGNAKEVCEFLEGQVAEEQIESAVTTQREFAVGERKHCIIVEDFGKSEREIEAEEKWKQFHEGTKLVYFVSNKGRVKYKRKDTGNEYPSKMVLNKDGVAVVRVQQKQVQVKNLVAKHFSREYAEMLKTVKQPYVGVIDGNPMNCDVSNLEVYSNPKYAKVAKRWKPCALYENGKKVKTYRSLKDAGKDLYYNYQDLAHYFSGDGYIKTIPYDLRLLKSNKVTG